MFDKHAVDEYRSITAPENLRERVVGAAKKKTRSPIRILPLIGAVAACIVLLFTANLSLGGKPNVTITGGQTLDPVSSLSIPVSVSSRNSAAYCTTFTVSANGSLEIDTDDTLFVIENNGDLLSTFPYRASDIVNLCWYITTPEATFTVNGVDYALTADEEHGTVTIVQD